MNLHTYSKYVEVITIQELLVVFNGKHKAICEATGLNAATVSSKLKRGEEYLFRVYRDGIGDVEKLEPINKSNSGSYKKGQ